MKITVIVPDMSIMVGTIAHVCTEAFAEPYDFRVLHWNRSKAVGWIEHFGKPNEKIAGPRGRALVRPYLAAWQKCEDAAQAEEAARDAKRREAETEQKRREAEEKEAAARRKREAEDRRAQYERDAPLREAHGILTDSDHEIIKAMEAKLAQEGALPADLVKRRRDARGAVKSLRKELHDA